VATLAPQAGGRHVALRADIDALPITEASGADWSSQRPGCMHACGHDGHTATLFAAAWWLKQHESELPGPVSLFFQPAEEGGHGALRMIEDGALQGIDCIFGWHNWPAISFGKAVCPDGPVMAANGTFQINITGQGGHASQPESCRDPVLAAAAITTALQQIVARRLPPQQAAVISVTSIEAPSAATVIPDTAQIGGSFRIADDGLREQIGEWITEISQATAQAHGVTADVLMQPRYGVTVNHPAAAAQMRRGLAHCLGPDWHSNHTPVPIMASEDFSYYLREVPGAYALIGADDGQGHDLPCHSPRYDFNDALIPLVARLYLQLASAPSPDSL
ncbi:MAG: N(2)-acetyl-L-2,4-diaminobutanoate deacetylase DoeB2, partial [Nevskiales bacterium]